MNKIGILFGALLAGCGGAQMTNNTTNAFDATLGAGGNNVRMTFHGTTVVTGAYSAGLTMTTFTIVDDSSQMQCPALGLNWVGAMPAAGLTLQLQNDKTQVDNGRAYLTYQEGVACNQGFRLWFSSGGTASITAVTGSQVALSIAATMGTTTAGMNTATGAFSLNGSGKITVSGL